MAKILHIPPVLLGLSSLTLFEWGDGAPLSASVALESIAPPKTMLEYERLLALSWELYYTSTVQKAAESIGAGFQQLFAEAEHATGIKKDQHDAMLCRFYQLSSLVSRDRMELNEAIEHENKAVAIAFRLKNAELIASSLLRRARIYLRQENYDLAYQDAEQMIPYANLSRDPLKGKCYQMAGEATGYIAGDDLSLQKKSMEYFDKAARIARKGDLTADGSFVKTDLTSIFIEKADALVLFKRFDDAHAALAVARKNLSPEQNRWKINLSLAEARAYLAQQDVTSCSYSLIEALGIVRAVNLPTKEDRILELSLQCQGLEPHNQTLLDLKKLLAAPAA